MELKIEYIPITEIIPYTNNPRKNDKAVDVVAKSIKEFGFNVPILLDKNNVIIAGHTRLKAAEQLKLNTVPVIWLDDLTPEQAKAFRIMDNKTSEFAEWDNELLKLEFNDLKRLNYKLDLTGFRDEEIDMLLLNFQPTTHDEQGRIDEREKYICPKCGHQFTKADM